MSMKKGTIYVDNLSVTSADGYKYLLLGTRTPVRCVSPKDVSYMLHNWAIENIGNYTPPIAKCKQLETQIEKLSIGGSLSFWMYRHLGYVGKAITKNMMLDALKQFTIVRIS